MVKENKHREKFVDTERNPKVTIKIVDERCKSGLQRALGHETVWVYSKRALLPGKGMGAWDVCVCTNVGATLGKENA